MLRLLLDELLLRRRSKVARRDEEGRVAAEGGRKVTGTWVDLEVRTSLRGSGRGEGGVLLYRCIYTRRNSFIFAHRMCRVRVHVHARTPSVSAIILLCIDANARARSTIADAIRSTGAIFAYCGFQKRRCATSPLPNTSAC